MHEPSRSRSLTMLSLTFLVAVMAMVAPSMAEAADHESLPGPAVVRFAPARERRWRPMATLRSCSIER